MSAADTTRVAPRSLAQHVEYVHELVNRNRAARGLAPVDFSIPPRAGRQGVWISRCYAEHYRSEFEKLWPGLMQRIRALTICRGQAKIRRALEITGRRYFQQILAQRSRWPSMELVTLMYRVLEETPPDPALLDIKFDRLLEIRKARGMGQQQVATLCHTDPSAISRLENGLDHVNAVTAVEVYRWMQGEQ